MKPRDPNLSALKKGPASTGVPRPLNLGDGTPRTNSDLLSSEGDSSVEGDLKQVFHA